MDGWSSDEDIFWGPVTLREIKSDFKRPVLRKPIRRHTTYCEQTSEINKMSNIASEDTILDISAYLTASEAASVKNDTQYYSTDENVIKHNIPADESNSELDRFDNNILQESPSSSKSTDKPHLNISQNVMDKSSNKLLQESPLSSETTNKSHLNLLQNVMNKSSNVIKTEHELIESPINMNESLYVIEISSEDEEEQVETEAHLNCSLDTSDSSIINNSYYSEKDCSKQEYCENVSYLKECDESPLDQSAVSESKYPTTSAITIPDIDLQQFNDSSICLNDTIDKINAILNQADEESFTESPIKTTHIKNGNKDELNIEDLSISPFCKQNSKSNTSGDEDNFQTCNLISGSFLQKPISDLSPKQTPTNYQTRINSNYTIKSHIPVPKRSPDIFKLPALPTPKTKPNLKNIISPVGMYIKYSPKPVLKRMDSTEIKKLQKPTNSKNKENLDIPSKIVYKPSKNPVLGSERNICMPASLEKMVGKSTVIRHARNPVSVSLFKKDVSLDQGLDLTTDSLNITQFSDNDQNKSVWHKTPAFRK